MTAFWFLIIAANCCTVAGIVFGTMRGNYTLGMVAPMVGFGLVVVACAFAISAGGAW